MSPVKACGSPVKAAFDVKSGGLGWRLMGELYDFVQEIARSGYGDMLHDHQRVSIHLVSQSES